jgi:radical SAM superfamily enzyme YgiQ (UPF0313 family)
MKYHLILFSDIYRPLHGKGLGIYRLANHLRKCGYRVKVIHGFVKISDEEFFLLCEKFISEDTVCIGLGATVLANLENLKFFGVDDDIAKNRFLRIKQNYPQISLCIGGAQITGLSDQNLNKFDYFDYAIKGQGENSLLALLDHLTKKTKILTSSVTKPKIITDKTYPFDDFNSSFNEFTDDDGIQPGEGLPIEVARGCIFKCKFCGYDLIGKKIGDYTKSGDLIRKELIENYERWGVTEYYIADETINDSPEKIDMLLDSVSNLNFKPNFGGFLRLDLIWRYPEMAKKLLDMGLETCSFGIETINDASGKAVGKGLGKKRIEETLDHLRNIWGDKVFVNASFILGLKHDTKETFIELDLWLNDQFFKKNLHTVFVKPLYIMPSNGVSYLDQHYIEQGYRLKNTDEFSISDRTRSVIANDCITWETDTYDYLTASIDADYVHNKYNDSKICKGKIAKHNYAFVKSLLPSNYKSQLMRSMIYDVPFEGLSISETEDLIHSLDQEHYKHYLYKLLNPTVD